MADEDATNKRFDLTSFLFGNVDEHGKLENDFLDDESKKHLSSLAKLGLNPIITEIVEDDDVRSEYSDVSSSENETFSSTLDIKSPSAVDYSDIKELADEDDYATNFNGLSGSESDSMPPPLAPLSRSVSNEYSQDAKRKLDTPLAGILPQKYANIDVKELFPEFRSDKVLRFSRLFSSAKANSCNRWKSVKKRIKRRLQQQLQDQQSLTSVNYKTGWVLNFGSPPTSPSKLEVDDEELLLKPYEDKENDKSNDNLENVSTEPKVADWRFGPAQLWYDMLNVPENGEGFDYGFKLKEKIELEEADYNEKGLDYPDDAFLMISQVNWEDDVIWNGDEIRNKVLQKLNSKANLAGWIPTSSNRFAQTFSQPGKGISSALWGSSVKLTNTTDTSLANKSNKNIVSTKIQPSQSEECGDDTWYSIFPVENEELIYSIWEDEIIWDDQSMKYIPKPKILTLDPNDENIILGVPRDIDPTKQRQDSTTPAKVKVPHPHVKKSKLLLGKAGVINMLQEDMPLSPTKSPDHDPFNISNDKYYMSRTSETSLKVGVGSLIQHSTPVIELRAPFVQTHMGTMRLRSFHRPPIKRYSHGVLASNEKHYVTPLAKYIKKKYKAREQECIASGGGDIFFMRTPEDLTGRDGDLVLVEYCEEHPPLMNLVGMCSKVKNYYKRKAGKDQGPQHYKYGEIAYAHTSPFLGTLSPGKSLQALENNMYRTPIYEHDIPETDFLVIRTRNQYFIREVNSLYVAGQMCPLYEVPSPNSKRANNFVRDFLQVFIYRLFWKSKGVPKRICMDDVRRAFPSHSESSIRKRLKLCADFKRTGNDSNLWVIKKDFRLPPEEEIREMVSPEQCCAYFSMIAAEQRLKDAGYGEKFLFPTQDDDEDDLQLKMDDEIKVAPWNTTRAYIQAMKGKCLLQLTGPADPTGCGEGFSYIRVPNKPVTRQSKEEQKSQPKRIVTGTDADLRRLSLNNAKALLRKFGVPEEEIKQLSRWEVIDVVRTLSTEKAKAGEEGMTKFSRGNRFSIAEHQERYKEECQRIFELQNKVLSSNEVLSTDEDESTDEENGSDIEEMGKNIENMLSNKKTSMQLSLEKEEQERQELRKLIMEHSSDDIKRAKDKKKDEDNCLNDLSNQAGRVLKIYRTFRDADGKEYTRLEVVRKPAVIDAYVKIRTTKDEEFIKQFAVLDDAQKEEMKREKRRIQEQLRRIKRNQEKERITAELKSRAGQSGLGNNKPGSYGGRFHSGSFDKHHKNQQRDLSSGNSLLPPPAPPSRRRPKLKPDLKVKCGACGATGHMRTNKACPQYQQNAPPPPVVVALTQEQEHEFDKKLEDVEDLVNIEGTKVKLSSKLIRHAEDVKRRSLLLKVPKDALVRKRKSTNEDLHCDYLKKHKKPANRRCTDPVVALSSTLESILNEMRSLSDVQPFLFPVNPKNVPDYYKIVTRPMDLQTMRDRLRLKKYQTREEFLADVNQIVENSTLYNGAKSILTLAAKQMLQLCVKRLAEKEDKLMRLEKAINPLLDDNDQVALSFILGNVMNKIKTISESWPFSKPVNKRTVKDYYEIVKRPMDLETINTNIHGQKYHSRYDFLSDIELILKNCIAYNGIDSTFTEKAETLFKVTQSYLEEYDEHLSILEEKLKVVQDRVLYRTTDVELFSDDQTQDSVQSFVYDNENESAVENFMKPDTQQLLDDLHCSSEDDDIDMMEEVKGIEVEVGSGPDYESQQVAEAMMQLGNFDYRTSSEPSTRYDMWHDNDPEAEVLQEEFVDEEQLEVKAFPGTFPYEDNVEEVITGTSISPRTTELKIMQEDLEISDSDEEIPTPVIAIKQEKPAPATDADDTDGLWF